MTPYEFIMSRESGCQALSFYLILVIFLFPDIFSDAGKFVSSVQAIKNARTFYESCLKLSKFDYVCKVRSACI